MNSPLKSNNPPIKNFLVLVSMVKPESKTHEKLQAKEARLLVGNLQKIDAKAKPIWFDSSHVGVAISAELKAWEISQKAINKIGELNDILIVQLGSDWCARHETLADHWLKSHVGSPK